MEKLYNIMWRSQAWTKEFYLTKTSELTTNQSKAVRLPREDCNKFLLAVRDTPAWKQAGQDSYPEIVEAL